MGHHLQALEIPLPTHVSYRFSLQAMRVESDCCSYEVARLEPAAAKLHALSVELNARREGLLESRKAAAAQDAQKRCVYRTSVCEDSGRRVAIGTGTEASDGM